MSKLPGRHDIKEFLDLFDGESDRAAVVLGGAYLDSCLDEMLRTWLADHVDEHFEPPNGLLSSYGAKYQLAHALGALDETNRVAFKRIGAIRNHFAHHVLEAKWSHPNVQKSLRGLRTQLKLPDSDPDRNAYLFAVLFYSRHLQSCEKETLATMRSEALVRALRQHQKSPLSLGEALVERAERRKPKKQ